MGRHQHGRSQCIDLQQQFGDLPSVGWIEIAGAGLVHPQVLRNGGIDPNQYSGLAWGFGPDRMLMAKLGIDDIRSFYEGDLRFLKQF